MASASARLCFLAGFPVAVLEHPSPLAVRRLVCFAEAVFSGRVEVEGVEGRRVAPDGLLEAAREGGAVPVAVDPAGEALSALRPEVLVDGRMAKARQDTHLEQAPFVIGLGPGFRAGQDVHVVVETQRGPALGRVIRQGAAEADTTVPSPVMGLGEERVLRAPCAGRFLGSRRIGDLVAAGEAVGTVEGEPVLSRAAGLIRGLVADGVALEPGVKLGDVDPRGHAVDPAAISDKARAVAAGVLEAVLLRARLTPL